MRAAAPIVEPDAPRLPPADKRDQRDSAASALMATATAIAEMQGLQVYQQQRRRSRTGLHIMLALVLLAALVAAGVVFGRPYLFPDDWDADVQPYADAIEAVRGVAFADPLAITTDTASGVAGRVTTELLGSSDEAPMWRAFGLTNGASTHDDISEHLTGWQNVVYSTVDGQVYHDASDAAAQYDAKVTQAMTAAALDQEYGWSTGLLERSLDDRAAVSAEVLRQAREVQLASSFDAAVDPVDPSKLDAAPSVVAYSALAPHMYAEFAGGAGDTTDTSNLPHDLGEGGPELLPGNGLSLAAAAVIGDGDVVASSPVTMDRSFWYLAFAGFVDSRSAFLASEAIVESALVMADRGSAQCAFATFSGSGVDETALLRDVLGQWAAAAPAEFGASFSVLDDGTLQLVSCDPGPQFNAPVTLGAHRALLGWRVAELATAEAVRASGSADFDTDFAWAWVFVASSTLPDELAALPSSTAPAAFVEAARTGVATILSPQPPPEAALEQP